MADEDKRSDDTENADLMRDMEGRDLEDLQKDMSEGE
jgi:hypothetical protein